MQATRAGGWRRVARVGVGLGVGLVAALAQTGVAWGQTAPSTDPAGGGPEDAAVAMTLSAAPVYPFDFPDPGVLVDGPDVYFYATGTAGSNLQAIGWPGVQAHSATLDPLRDLPVWAEPPWTWAPGVVRIGSRYLMYYTAHSVRWNMQCIAVATSREPLRRFVDPSWTPFICQRNEGGSIDPQPFVAPDGGLYLIWKSDNITIGGRPRLWAQRLTALGLGRIGAPVAVLDMDPRDTWQGDQMEGPAMAYDDGVYYLFYGANSWFNEQAGIGYATCAGPLGPCTNQSVAGPWLGSRSGAPGPSGPAVFTDPTGQRQLAYHAWVNGVGYPQGARALWIDRLSFVDHVPVLGTPDPAT